MRAHGRGGVTRRTRSSCRAHLQLIGGLRVDRFDLQYHNNRNGDTLGRTDNLVSPRAGVVVKPMAPLSIYGSYSVSYLPSSGDQFSSLTAVTQQLKPEQFTNYEVGVKWDVAPRLSLTTAVYRLDRTNTRSTDPNDPTRIVQTGSQRTNGLRARRERAASPPPGGSPAATRTRTRFVTSATAAARLGAQVGQVPHHTFSLWNHYQFQPRLAAAVGIVHRTDMFAAIDNTVTLPGYTRADAARLCHVTEGLRLQANVENVFDERYYVNADSNTNISPGQSAGGPRRADGKVLSGASSLRRESEKDGRRVCLTRAHIEPGCRWPRPRRNVHTRPGSALTLQMTRSRPLRTRVGERERADRRRLCRREGHRMLVRAVVRRLFRHRLTTLQAAQVGLRDFDRVGVRRGALDVQ